MGYSSTGETNRKKFTGYERDNETGLDFAQARYNSSTLGRFTSPDPYGGSMGTGDPQSFNRYAYVGNNPVNATDSTGLSREAPGGNLPGAEGAMGRVQPGNGGLGTDSFVNHAPAYVTVSYLIDEPEAETSAAGAQALGKASLALDNSGSDPATITGVVVEAPQNSENQLVFLDAAGTNGTGPFENTPLTTLNNAPRAQFPYWADGYDKLIIDVLFTGFSQYVDRVILARDDSGKPELHFASLFDKNGAINFLETDPQFITGSFGGEHIADVGETALSKVVDAKVENW